MEGYRYLDPTKANLLFSRPASTFIPMEYKDGKVSSVAMLTLEESDGYPRLTKDSLLTLRPDRVPEEALSLSMLSMVPICLGTMAIGWYLSLPAMLVTVGRNYIRIMRPRLRVSEKDHPQLSVALRSLIVMEVPDVMTVVLSTSVKDVRT